MLTQTFGQLDGDYIDIIDYIFDESRSKEEAIKLLFFEFQHSEYRCECAYIIVANQVICRHKSGKKT